MRTLFFILPFIFITTGCIKQNTEKSDILTTEDIAKFDSLFNAWEKEIHNNPKAQLSSSSRRFICIEVTAPIQTNVTINYKQLYDQAMEAIYKGERYWLNDEDENILKQTNREFEQASPLEQLFHCYLNPVEEEMEGEWLTAMQILSYLQTKTRDKLAISKVGQFGRALQKLNIPCRKSRKGTLYHLVKVE